jgi:hypothetical protein
MSRSPNFTVIVIITCAVGDEDRVHGVASACRAAEGAVYQFQRSRVYDSTAALLLHQHQQRRSPPQRSSPLCTLRLRVQRLQHQRYPLH